MKRLTKKQKWLWSFFALFVVLVVATSFGNDLAARKGQEFPSYSPKDITSLIEQLSQQGQLNMKEFDLLYRQTGLSASAAVTLANQGKATQILDYQNALFHKAEYKTLSTNLCTGEETLTAPEEDLLAFPDLQDGDILVTAAAHTLGWRHGHCGLVIDAEKGEILEAFTWGKPSEICSLKKWLRYPNVIQLRLKESGTSQNTGLLAANHGRAELNGVPYSLFSDFHQDSDTPKTTHCAHLIRDSYLPYGIELKRGFLVTPKDIANSDDFNVIQVRGMDPITLWE
ncbi:MAG: hypothetical protein U0M15_00390 [Bacillota bacterium]|nr:hypothetical protein [Bacillota bacterium]